MLNMISYVVKISTFVILLIIVIRMTIEYKRGDSIGAFTTSLFGLLGIFIIPMIIYIILE